MPTGKWREALAYKASHLCSINTLANTMKHCINVSNYWLEERVGCVGGEERGDTQY